MLGSPFSGTRPMSSALMQILSQSSHAGLLKAWQGALAADTQRGSGRISPEALRLQTSEFLELLTHASTQGGVDEVDGEAFVSVRSFLDEVSRTRAIQGFSADQTAYFILSLKKPLFSELIGVAGNDAAMLGESLSAATHLVDQLALHTVSAFQKAREHVIERQQQELLELSTPVVKLWDGILALPMIGTLDSARTQIVMESLLQRIADTGSEIAIIDITGVPTVDTLVAQHLLKTVTAIRLMGAECIISGLRPQIAQTIVHLGVDLNGVTTKASLADALSLALKRTGFVISRNKS